MSNKLQTSNSSSALDKLNRTIKNMEDNKKGGAATIAIGALAIAAGALKVANDLLKSNK